MALAMNYWVRNLFKPCILQLNNSINQHRICPVNILPSRFLLLLHAYRGGVLYNLDVFRQHDLGLFELVDALEQGCEVAHHHPFQVGGRFLLEPDLPCVFEFELV